MTKKKQPSDKKTEEVVKDGDVPRTFSKQNLGHNAKKEGFSGQHTKR